MLKYMQLSLQSVNPDLSLYMPGHLGRGPLSSSLRTLARVGVWVRVCVCVVSREITLDIDSILCDDI